MSHPLTPAAGCGAACPLAAAVPGVDRRTFISQAVLAAAATALAACGGSGDGPTSPSTIATTSVSLASYPALAAVGGVTTLTTVNGVPIAVVRTGASSFVALSRRCPHAGTTVNVVSGGFLCPNHGAQFNTAGTWIGGQRTGNLTAYPTSYDAATGELTIG